MRKVNLEIIRKELYSNLKEMYFGAFYHMTELSKVCFDACVTNKYKVTTLYDVLEIKRSRPFSDYEWSIYIGISTYGVFCYSVNSDYKYYEYQWEVNFSDTKSKALLFMEITKHLTMTLC